MARPTARAAWARAPTMVARVRLATAKKSGTKARSISPASARTICSLSPGCTRERERAAAKGDGDAVAESRLGTLTPLTLAKSRGEWGRR